MGKHERMVPNSLPLPCGDNRGGETHCSRRIVPAPSRNTGLGRDAGTCQPMAAGAPGPKTSVT